MASASAPLTGCVKWFDNGLNYGFITVLSAGEHYNADIFVHQSNIQTKRECFRTLYTGECVQFMLAKSDNEKHPFHAVNVNGFNGVMLHCENPNYRPSRPSGAGSGRGNGNGNGRGNGSGRGGSRGGGGGRRRDGYQSQMNPGHQEQDNSQDNSQDTVSASASAPAFTADMVSVSAPAISQTSTPVFDTKRGRGRGKASVL